MTPPEDHAMIMEVFLLTDSCLPVVLTAIESPWSADFRKINEAAIILYNLMTHLDVWTKIKWKEDF